MDGLKPSLIIYWWLKIQYILMHIQGIKEKRFGRFMIEGNADTTHRSHENPMRVNRCPPVLLGRTMEELI